MGKGVRQGGGVHSPARFNIYMNDPSDQLRASKTGCMVGNVLVNHLMNADDLAIFSPSSRSIKGLASRNSKLPLMMGCVFCLRNPGGEVQVNYFVE